MNGSRNGISGFPEELPGVDLIFPFLKYRANSVSSDLNGITNPSVISHESSNEWIWLGENGFENVDDPPLEPIFDSSTWTSIQNETGDTDWKIIESVMADVSNHRAEAGLQNERRDNLASECFNGVCGTLGNKTFSTTVDVQRDFFESATNQTNRNLLKNYCVSEDLKMTCSERKEKKYEISFDLEISHCKSSPIKTINFESAKDIESVLEFMRANSAAVAGEKLPHSSPNTESSFPTEHNYSMGATDSDPGLQSSKYSHLFEVNNDSSSQSSIELRKLIDRDLSVAEDSGSNPARSQTGKRKHELKEYSPAGPRRSKRQTPYKHCRNCRI